MGCKQSKASEDPIKPVDKSVPAAVKKSATIATPAAEKAQKSTPAERAVSPLE